MLVVITVIITILQIRKLRLRIVKLPAKFHKDDRTWKKATLSNFN